MKKLFLFILVIICIGLLICCPSFRENEAEVASENTLTDFDEDTSYVFEHPVTELLYAELDSDEVYNEKVLFGYWFKPHEANAVNIFLHKDYTYEFNYYIRNEKNSIILYFKKGIFTFDGKVIQLSAPEGWDKAFNGELYFEHNGTNAFLTDKTEFFYLVKGSD
jgi:hypothetical protein